MDPGTRPIVRANAVSTGSRARVLLLTGTPGFPEAGVFPRSSFRPELLVCVPPMADGYGLMDAAGTGPMTATRAC